MLKVWDQSSVWIQFHAAPDWRLKTNYGGKLAIPPSECKHTYMNTRSHRSGCMSPHHHPPDPRPTTHKPALGNISRDNPTVDRGGPGAFAGLRIQIIDFMTQTQSCKYCRLEFLQKKEIVGRWRHVYIFFKRVFKRCCREINVVGYEIYQYFISLEKLMVIKRSEEARLCTRGWIWTAVKSWSRIRSSWLDGFLIYSFFLTVVDARPHFVKQL